MEEVIFYDHYFAPQEEARLVALARAKGLSTDALVREAINRILTEAPNPSPKEPSRSLRGLFAKYGQAPSAGEIDQNRAEMFANFPRSDFVAPRLQTRCRLATRPTWRNIAIEDERSLAPGCSRPAEPGHRCYSSVVWRTGAEPRRSDTVLYYRHDLV